MTPTPNLRARLDADHASAQSIVLRYRDLLQFDDSPERDARLKELFAATTIREGARVLPLCSLHGVQIDILDESSWMSTRSLKSIDGCVTTAHGLLDGLNTIVFESGGNTGSALARYSARVGIESYFFAPEQNLHLLDSSAFTDPRSHLVAVASGDNVKRAASSFAAEHGYTHVPRPLWRHQASQLLGCFVLEHFLDHGTYDYLAQSISAAFGPIGIYSVLENYRRELGRLPRFMGFQQAANCAMVAAWRAHLGQPMPEVADDPLSRVMYDKQPGTYGTFDKLRAVLEVTGGDLATVHSREFAIILEPLIDGCSAVDLLRGHGAGVTLRDGEIVDKTGLIGLAGVLRAVSSGAIAPGNRVLVCLTGGTADPDGLAVPDFRVADTDVGGAPVGPRLVARSEPNG